MRASPSLVELSREVLVLGARLRDAHLPDVATFRACVLDGLGRIEKDLDAAGRTRADIEDVRYALIAYLDELVQYSDWSGRIEWRARPLQAELFGETVAGERFFERMAGARHRKSPEVLEVYLLCILMGFRGMYRMREGELEQLVSDARFHIGSALRVLSPDGVQPIGPRSERRRVPLGAVGVALLALSVVVTAVLWVASQSRAGDAATRLAEMFSR